MLIHRVGRVLLTEGIRGIRPRLAVRCSLAAKVIYAYWSGIPDLYRRSQRLAETEDVQGWHAFNARETRAYRKLPISAIIRMRNVAPTLHLSVESIIASVSEVWLVDNGSDDASLEVARALQERYPDQVRLSQYPHQLGSYGPTYLDQVESDETRSVAAFYNFSFRLGTAKYLLKWDADMIALPSLPRVLRRCADDDADVLSFDGLDLTGTFSSVMEDRLFRSSLAWQFVDTQVWEKLTFQETPRRMIAAKPCYLHLKQLLQRPE